MYAPTANAAPPRSVLMRLLVRSWEYRHPLVWVRVRFACGLFNLVLGALLLAARPQLGPLAWLGILPLAAAVLIFWTGYRLRLSVET